MKIKQINEMSLKEMQEELKGVTHHIKHFACGKNVEKL